MNQKITKLFAFVGALLLMLNTNSWSSDSSTEDRGNGSTKKVYYFKISDNIFPAAWRQTQRAIEEAEEQNVEAIILHLNTYGGLVDVADSIRTKLLKTEIPTIAFIDNNAASAGALIALACDSIFMVKAAQMGAATVVNQTGEAMPDKYQSYMRATMRSTAEAQGRDPEIAEAMVDPEVEIEGVIAKGKTLTFTTSEAIEHKFCEGEVENLDHLLKHLELKEAEMLRYEKSGVDSILGFLLHPMVSSILLLLIFGGIYFEIQTPGVGFPLAAAVIAAVLYFAPNYIEGLAENWEIILFGIGLLLIALEIFVIPGFGLAGILGIAAVVVSLVLSLTLNDFFDFSYTPSGSLTRAMGTVFFSMAIALVGLIAFGGSLFNSPFFKKISLQKVQKAEEGYTIASKKDEVLVGQLATAATDLRVSGIICFEGLRYDAITTGEFINKGQKVRILESRGNYFVVSGA